MSNVFTPETNAEKIFGEGDWRPVLGAAQRDKEIKVIMVGKQSIEHRLRGLLMPSMDYRLSLDDAAFPNSVAPFWTDVPDDQSPRHFTPNAWGIPLLMYPFMGEKKEHWISPRNRLKLIGNDNLDPEDAHDAFDDLNKWVRRNKDISKGQKDALLKGESMYDDPIIPGCTVRYVSMAECTDKEASNYAALVVYTSACHAYLVEQARWAPMAEQGPATAPRDPNWPNYLIGDPTDPKAALMWNVNKIRINPTDTTETNVMTFTERREFLDIDRPAKTISPEMLAKRFTLADPANWNIPTYEEQVEHMMTHFDTAVSADMIRAACGNRCRTEIPTSRPESVTVKVDAPAATQQSARTSREPDSAASSDPMAAVTGGLTPAAPLPPVEEAPPAPAPAEEAPPAPAPAEEAPPAPAPAEEAPTEKKYWGGLPKQDPQQFTISQLQALVDDGNAESFKVSIVTDEGAQWFALADSGLVKAPTPAETAPTPPAETAPTPPAETAPATPGAGCTIEEMHAMLFPDSAAFDALSAEKREKANALVKSAWDATEQGAKQDLPQEIITELLAIVG